MTAVYIEHPRNHLQSVACDMPGWLDSFYKSDGAVHTFTTDDDAINFIWTIRRRTARYVEVSKSIKPLLDKFVQNKGFDNSDGIVSKYV